MLITTENPADFGILTFAGNQSYQGKSSQTGKITVLPIRSGHVLQAVVSIYAND